MELTMSMFATQSDYWKARAELAERTVLETAHELGCEPDNEVMLMQASIMRKALERIVRWHGEFPETGRFWDEPKNTEPMSYSACYGSNGERDYMRQVASDALLPNVQRLPCSK